MKNRDKAIVNYSRECSCRAMVVAPEITGAAFNTRGFTLVELIIVIGIVVILGTLAIPAFQKYSEKAKVYRCVADIHNMGTGIAAYAIENQNNLPPNLTVLSSIGLSNLKDSWGNTFAYNVGGQYKDFSGIDTLNTDYDLYSRGKDGLTTKDLSAGPTTSSDDVIRAREGAYVGAAVEF
jgi:prepilin-type N-terminal cleavage/methylation domain-containing protein